MTQEQIEQERKDFESWIALTYPRASMGENIFSRMDKAYVASMFWLRLEIGDYKNNTMQYMWEGWIERAKRECK